MAAPESAAPEPPTPTVSEGRAAASCPIALQIEEAERLEKRGELGSAVSQLQKASEAADLDSDLHWRIGRAYRRMGKTDLAGVSLRRVLLLSPNQWAAALQLAGVLFEQEDFAASEREYGRAQRILESTDGVEPFYQEEIRATCRRRVAECRIRLSVR